MIRRRPSGTDGSSQLACAGPQIRQCGEASARVENRLARCEFDLDRNLRRARVNCGPQREESAGQIRLSASRRRSEASGPPRTFSLPARPLSAATVKTLRAATPRAPTIGSLQSRPWWQAVRNAFKPPPGLAIFGQLKIWQKAECKSQRYLTKSRAHAAALDFKWDTNQPRPLVARTDTAWLI